MLGQRGNYAGGPADRPQGRDGHVCSSSTASKHSRHLPAEAHIPGPTVQHREGYVFLTCPVRSKPSGCLDFVRRLKILNETVVSRVLPTNEPDRQPCVVGAKSRGRSCTTPLTSPPIKAWSTVVPNWPEAEVLYCTTTSEATALPWFKLLV